MNNKGFAITGIIYSVLILFLVIITLMLFNLQNRKIILDELKADAVDAVESDNNYDYLLSEINALKAKIGTTDISSLGDGTITGAIGGLNNSPTNNYEFIGSGIYTSASKTSVNIDVTKYKAFLVTSGINDIVMSIIIPAVELDSSTKAYVSSRYWTSSNYQTLQVFATNTAITGIQYLNNGSDSIDVTYNVYGIN